MRVVLHILTKAGDSLAQGIVARQSGDPDVDVIVSDVTTPAPDYDRLVEDIFTADCVAVW